VRFVADDCVAETVIREFVRSLAAKHSIQSADQWTRITREQLGSNTLRRLRLMGGGLRRIIKKLGLSSVNRHAWTSRRKKALSFSKLVRLLFPSEGAYFHSRPIATKNIIKVILNISRARRGITQGVEFRVGGVWLNIR